MAIYNIGSDQTYKTISDVNSLSLQSGDQVLFKRGETFNDTYLNINSSGQSGNHIIFGSYGSGNLPIIGSQSSNWNQSIYIGTSSNYITIQDLFIYGTANGGVSNSVGIKNYGDNIIIDGCTIVGGNASQSTTTYGIHVIGNYVTIKNCDISYFTNLIGNGGVSNVTIEYNNLHHASLKEYQGYANSGGACIRFTKNYANAHDTNYTMIIRHNDIHHFEWGAFGIGTIARVIVEYNYIHDNLDERIYTGGIKHGTCGKMFDNQGVTEGDGGIGTIFRYNVVYNLKKFGEVNKTYDNGVIVNENNGYGRPAYVGKDTDGSLWGDESSHVPDGTISGLGYGNFWIHNNLFYEIDHQVFGKGMTETGWTFRDDYADHIYSNTYYNVYKKAWTGAAAFHVSNTSVPSPTFYANNIIYLGNTESAYPCIKQYPNSKAYNNLYNNRTGYYYGSSGQPSNLAFWQLYRERYDASTDEPTEIYNGNAGFNDVNATITLPNVGISGVTVPDFRLSTSSPAIGNGTTFGNDPTGININIGINGTEKTNGEIGAFTVSDGTVTTPTITITSQPSSKSAQEGGSTSFTCAFTISDGSTNKGYQWWRTRSGNVTKITNDGHYSGAESSTLTITGIESIEDQDSFVCECKNLDGYPEEGYWKNSNSAVLSVTPITEDYLTVSPSSVTLSNQANVSSTANVSSNVSWEIINIPSWLDVSPITGNGSTTITLTTLSANTNTQQRSINLTIRQV